MTAQEKFDEFVRDGFWPFLRAHGFTRTKATFHRPVGDNWEVISLQKSKWSDRDSVEFTVNLGVGLWRLRERQYDWADGKRPPDTRCQLRERLALLLSDRDVWWEVGRRSDTSALAETVTAAVERYAFPWLAARSTEDALRALLRADHGLRAEPIHHLCWFEKLAAQLGEEELAQRVIAERKRKEAELDERRRLEDIR